MTFTKGIQHALLFIKKTLLFLLLRKTLPLI